MGLSIHLLGIPRVERDGAVAPAPKGRKVWALLAYLLLSESAPSRSQLAGLLFSEADDPLRALRWNLNAIRQLLGEDTTIEGEPVTLRLPPGAFVDALVLPRSTWLEAVAVPAMEEDLLGGMDFATAPTFETWLTNQRRHLHAAAGAALAEGTVARLAVGDAVGAVDLASRLVALEPLDEDHHSLLIRALTAAGDHAGADRHIATARELFRRELGVDPVAALTEARSAPAFTPTAARGLAAVRAQMQAGQAAIVAGARDVGLAYLRQAAAESQVLGDHVLQTQALLVMGSEMVHASRGRQVEGSAALHRVLALAQDAGDEDLAVTAHHHLAWVDMMAARFGPMHRRLEDAAAFRVDDEGVRCWGLLTRGLGCLATAHYAEAEAAVRELVAVAAKTGAQPLRSFGLVVLAGVFVHRGQYDVAREIARESVDVAHATGSLALISLATAKLGEVELDAGHVGAGAELSERALALSDQILETCVQSMASKQLGVLDFHRGELDRAIARLSTAWSRPMMQPDHVWKGAVALDALCDVAVRERLPNARAWVTDLESLASRTGMRELLVHAYLHRHALGDDTGEAAAMLAGEIDSPRLHDLVRDATGALVTA